MQATSADASTFHAGALPAVVNLDTSPPDLLASWPFSTACENQSLSHSNHYRAGAQPWLPAAVDTTPLQL